MAFIGIVIRITLTCLTFIVLGYSEISGQLYPYHNYTIKDGLPSNNVYSIKQDKKGYIWFNTDRGLVKHNGYEFKVYSTENGLPSNDNFSMLIDSQDNKWLYSFKSVTKLSNNDRVSIYNPTNSYFSFFLLDKEDHIYFLQHDVRDKTRFGYNLYVIQENQIYSDKIPDIPNTSDRNYLYKWKGNIYVLTFDTENLKINRSLKWDTIQKKLVSNKDFDCPRIVLNDPFVKAHEFLEIDSVYSILIGSTDFVLIKKNKKINQGKFPDGSYKYTIGDSYKMGGQFYIVLQSGIYNFSIDTSGNYKWKPFFIKPKVTGLLKDNEGNIWISTLGEGLYKYYGYGSKIGLNQVEYITEENILKIAGKFNNILWGFNNKNHLMEFEGKRQYTPKKLKDIRFLEIHDNNILYGGSNAFYINDVEKFKYGLKSFHIVGDTCVFASTFGTFFLSVKDLYLKPDAGFRGNWDISGRMYAVLYENGIFYSGNQQGLYWGRPQKDELIPICLDPDLETVSVNFIRKTSDGLLWVSTEGNGVFVLRNKETIKHFYGELLDGNIHSLKIDEKDQVWIATKNGVNKIVHDKNDQFTVKKYTSFHGLPSDYVNDVYCYNDTLYAATDEGLVRMDMKEIDRTDFNQAPPVYLNRIVLRENGHSSILRSDSTYILAHDQNNLTVSYSGISFRSNGNISYLYRLMPLNKEWRQTKNDELDFSDLQAGNYTFEVKAVNALGIVSPDPARYSFVIKPHFTRTWWFLIISVLALLGLAYLSAYLYFRNQRIKNLEKAKLDRQLTQLKLKSLQSQLNPHFIFNSLNAIQQFVNKEDKDQANIYLAMFAKLMRLYLMGSDSQFITLSQELEILRLYIQLEHLRFKDKFTYDLVIDSGIDLDKYKVPAMLIQPHVENAIRHGIAKDKRNDRKLDVFVKKLKKGVVVIISDNGIGRKKSLEIKKAEGSEHRSMGNKISKERLQMIRELNLAYIREKIVDLTDDNGQITGTRVELYILENNEEQTVNEVASTDNG